MRASCKLDTREAAGRRSRTETSPTHAVRDGTAVAFHFDCFSFAARLRRWGCTIDTALEPRAAPSVDPAPSRAAAGDVVLRLRGVRKTYKGTVAVESVDLDVQRGEFLTLLGPSGSGKTTTLRMIAGFELPDAGQIELDGVDVAACRRSSATSTPCSRTMLCSRT